jgi:hypothetical protein
MGAAMVPAVTTNSSIRSARGQAAGRRGVGLRHLIASCCVLGAGLVLWPAEGLGQEWASKMFAETTHNFGTVARGSKTEHRFTIRNIYKEDVHIAGVRTSCGCTSPVVTKDLLKTHDTSEVVATFNTRTFLGQHGATLTVTIDQPFYAEVQLRVDGNIRSDVSFDPPFIDLGNVDLGKGATQSVRVSRTGSLPWQIVDVRSANPMFEVTLSKPQRTATQTVYDLTLSLKPEAEPGYINSELILVTNDPRAEQIPMDVEGRVVAALTVSPQLLAMGVVQPGQSVTKNVVVRANQPFRVVDVTCGDTCVSCKVPDREATVQILPVTFTAGQTVGLIEREVQVATSLGRNLVQSIMLQVTVEPAAAQADTAPLANPDESADVSLPEAETQADAAR